MPIVKKLARPKPILLRRKVAAYARVSRDTDALMNSLSAQVDYYSSIIKNNPEWEFVGVYVDAGLTGTSISARPEFQRLIEDCRSGKIDIVLTKSISRFARNTVDLLSTVRDLKSRGVEVRFEKERINTLSGEGELMLTILASFAEEESLSLSRNVKWVIDKKYKEGKPHAHQKLFGYRWQGEDREIVPEEAEIVKFIFDSYTDGKSVAEIVKELHNQGRTGASGKQLTKSGIWTILSNVEYTGCLILQQSYNYRPRKSKRNYGELAMYLIEDHHPAIVSREQFDRAAEIRESKKPKSAKDSGLSSPFSSLIWCGKCGYKAFLCRSEKARKQGNLSHVSWRCGNKSKHQKCDCKNTRDRELYDAIYDLDVEIEDIKRIDMFDDKLEIYLKNGRMKRWKRGR